MAFSSNISLPTLSSVHTTSSKAPRAFSSYFNNSFSVQKPLTVPTVSATISPKAIEIEKGTQGSNSELGTNLYPVAQGGTDPLLALPFFANDALATFLGFGAAALANNPLLNGNAGTPGLQYIDWVKDSIVNSDTPSLSGGANGGVASGIITNVSGATFNGAKRGHWNGARMIDTIGNGEQDQFVQGGKEDDVSTWNVEASSIGSSKFDATQVYIANTSYPTTDTVNFPSGHKDVLYFGMERRGNNGTTCFDFEFNQLPPTGDYIPNRSNGDVLFTFEMNGSGSSGSAVPHVYIYSTSDNKYLTHEITNQIPAARKPLSTINMKPTPSAPWGYVDSHGDWTIGQIPNFSVAEAAVPFGVDFLQGVTACGGHAFVQVRTRSSVTVNSDLKDTTKFVELLFGGPTADLALQSNCNQTFTYSGAGSHDANGGQNLTFNWNFHVPAGVTLSSSDPELVVDAQDATHYTASFTSDSARNINVTLPAGAAYADITAQLTVVEGATCTDTTDTYTVRVWRQLGASATLTPACNALTFDYASTVTGGKSPYTYEWSFFKVGTATAVGSSSSASGTFTAPSDGDYYATLTVHDTADTSSDSHVVAKPSCLTPATSNTVTVNDAMNPVVTKDSADGTALTVTLKVTYHAPATIQWQKFVGGAWVNIAGANGDTYTYSGFESDDPSPVASTFSIGTDSYKGKIYSVQFRAHASRSTNGGCSQDSAPVTVKKVVAVDP